MNERDAARALKLARAVAEREPLNPNRDLNVNRAEQAYADAAWAELPAKIKRRYTQ